MQSQFNELKNIQTDKNEKIIQKVLAFVDQKFSDEQSLIFEYGTLKGYIECAEQLFWITESEFKKLEPIVQSAYQKHHLILKMQDSSKEEVGATALLNLLQRNLEHYGSGATTVKKVLLSLHDSNTHKIGLVSLRNLDNENFNDVIKVLEMNARCSPKRELYKYITNGLEIFKKMENEFLSHD